MAIGINPNFNGPQSANQAAMLQMIMQDQRLTQVASDTQGLNANEFADLMVRGLNNDFGQGEPGATQAESIYNQIKADADGFRKLSQKYRSGNNKPKPDKADKKDFNRSKKLFQQLKAGKITPQELVQKLREPRNRELQQQLQAQRGQVPQ